jgi:putative inorganic carbon (hco3(-)) transporter
LEQDLKSAVKHPNRRTQLGFAYFGLVLFMVVYFARPEDWIPGAGAVPLAKITGVPLILAFLFALAQVRGRLPKESVLLVVLLGQFFLTVLFSPVWRAGALTTTLSFAKVVPVVFVMVWVLNNIHRLRQLIFLQTVSVTIISAVTIWKAHTFHGRLEGMLTGNYDNPNDLACQIVICLPFCIAFLLRTRLRLKKLVWGLVVLMMTYTVIVTDSRGGFLALIVMFSVCIWQFAIKGRHRSLLIFAVAGLAFLLLFSGSVIQRFEAISSEEKNPNAYASAQQRQQVMKDSLKTTALHPLFGVGPGNFQVVSATELSGTWHDSHNTFLQLSSEAGLPALILYLMILWRAFSNLRVVKRHREVGPEQKLWAGALNASLLAFIVASVFASDAYQYFPYFLVAYTSALFLIAREGRVSLKTPSVTEDNSTSNEEKDEQGSESLQVYYCN